MTTTTDKYYKFTRKELEDEGCVINPHVSLGDAFIYCRTCEKYAYHNAMTKEGIYRVYTVCMICDTCHSTLRLPSMCQYCDRPHKVTWGKTNIPVCLSCYNSLRNKYWKMTGVDWDGQV